ncbi:hypothetical protein [Micromonospora gifhornensis]|uniref:hypothetical protein n=1 Tax=Micromonospora gifhornensis TaxID=84594 RepID=UPI0036672A1B
MAPRVVAPAALVWVPVTWLVRVLTPALQQVGRWLVVVGEHLGAALSWAWWASGRILWWCWALTLRPLWLATRWLWRNTVVPVGRAIRAVWRFTVVAPARWLRTSVLEPIGREIRETLFALGLLR